MLEKFRDKETDEHYMYKLAGLYAKNGARKTRQSGFVMKSVSGSWAETMLRVPLKLKKRLGGKLNAAQRRYI